MAARKKKVEPTAESITVLTIPVDAREFITVLPTSALWQMNPVTLDLDVKAAMQRGPIVRLFPPADAPDSLVDAIAENLLALGATAVRKMPAERATKTAAPEPEAEEILTPRQAVQAMVERWGETSEPRRAALKTLIEQVMAEEGL